MIFSLLVLAVGLGHAERMPFSRYQSIVDRQMFGQPPPGFDPTRPASEVAKTAAPVELTKEQEQVRSAIHFSLINITPAGETAVGFTDNSDIKAPVHYYLKVGEKRNGWEVKSADPVAATMTIAKGEIEVSLELGGSSSSAPGKGGAGPQPPGGGGRSGGNRSLAGNPGGGQRNSLLGGQGDSLRARREQRKRQRELAEAAEAAEEQKREQERAAERAKAEAEIAQREQDRELQRQQLQAIQEELKRAREARQAEELAVAEAAAAEGEP